VFKLNNGGLSMGITIHYRGKIDDIEKISKLVEDLEDFAIELGWESQRIDEDWSKPNTAAVSIEGDLARITGHAPLKGIILSPHKYCEPLAFTFNPDGYLIGFMGMTLIAEGKSTPEESVMGTKTQFAPIEVHITIIKLSQYIKKRYIPNLEVVDDGGYWETGDMTELKQRQGTIERAMDTLEDELSKIPREKVDNKSPGDIADMIEKLIRKKFGE